MKGRTTVSTLIATDRSSVVSGSAARQSGDHAVGD